MKCGSRRSSTLMRSMSRLKRYVFTSANIDESFIGTKLFNVKTVNVTPSLCPCVSRSLSLSRFLSLCVSVSLSVCVFLSLSLALCVCVSVSLCVCLSRCVCFCLSVSLYVCVCVCRSVSLCICLSLCVSVSLSLCVCVSVSLSLYMCVCLSVSQCIEGVIGGTDYNQSKVNQWTAGIVEHSLTHLVKQGRPFKYIGEPTVTWHETSGGKADVWSFDMIVNIWCFAVNCSIMQKSGAGLHTANSCFWDTTTDGERRLLSSLECVRYPRQCDAWVSPGQGFIH